MAIQATIFTVGAKYVSGQAKDEAGMVLESICTKMGWVVAKRTPLPDDEEQIAAYVAQAADSGKVDVVFTIDGVGILPTDRAAEALYRVCEKWIPGMSELIRFKSFDKNPAAALYRGMAGIRGKTVIINLPATPIAVKDAMDVLKVILRQTVEQLKGTTA